MEVADSIPPKPMQVVETLDDLDDILSTADNLADALDISSIKSEEPIKTNGEHSSNDHEQNDKNIIVENGDVIMVSEDEDDNRCHNDAGEVKNSKKDEAKDPNECKPNKIETNLCNDNGKEETDSHLVDQEGKKEIGESIEYNSAENNIIETHVITESEEEDTEPASQTTKNQVGFEKEMKGVHTKLITVNGEIPNGPVIEQLGKDDSDIEIISDEVDERGKEKLRFDSPKTEPPEKDEIKKDTETPSIIAESQDTKSEEKDKREDISEEKTDTIAINENIAKESQKEDVNRIENDVEILESNVVESQKHKKDQQICANKLETVDLDDLEAETEENEDDISMAVAEAIDLETEPMEAQETEVSAPISEKNGVEEKIIEDHGSDKIINESSVNLPIKQSDGPRADCNEIHEESSDDLLEKSEKPEPADNKEEETAEAKEPEKHSVNKGKEKPCEIINLDDSDDDAPRECGQEEKNETKVDTNVEEAVETKTVKPDPPKDTTAEVDDNQEDEFLLEIKSPRNRRDEEETSDGEPNELSFEIDIEPSSQDASNVDESMDIEEADISRKSSEDRIIELSDDDNGSAEDVKPPEPKRRAKETHDDKPRWSPQPSTSKCLQSREESVESDTGTKPENIKKDENEDDTIVISEDEECVFFDKECINCECDRRSKKYYKSPLFILTLYKTQRKSNKNQYVCDTCYDLAVKKYQVLMQALVDGKPLIEQEIPKRQDFVEILDSSDEEEDASDQKNKDEKPFRPEVVKMIANELESSITKVINRVQAHKQVEWTKKALERRLQKMKVESVGITRDLKQLQDSADRMHRRLYECPKIKIKELPPLDISYDRPARSETEVQLPPFGELKRPPITPNGTFFAVRNKAIASWLPCKVIESMDVVISGQKSVKYYKVRYLRLKVPTVKCVSAKHMAYGEAPTVRLSIGTRVIALFDGSTLSKNNKESIAPSAFYPGIVAEQLQVYNLYRYLIFFDDGYAQYVQHKDVRVVCQAAEQVWEDVHPASREFIHNYLSQYQKHRPMVQVKKGQCMITESNGKWLYAKVVDVDASLVQMQFDGQNRYEWIYRGSTRLGPLFKEKQQNGMAKAPLAIQRRSEPYVRYDEETTRNESTQAQNRSPEKQQTRAVAKKSTASQPRPDSQQNSANAPVVKHLNNSVIFLEDDNRPKGKVVYYTAKKNLPPKSFVPHECKPSCLFTITHNLHSYSPLAKPLLSGWERQIFKSKLKKSVVYRAPCGRRLRNMEELHRYLRLTKNVLNVDNFDFDCAIHCLAEYVIESSIVSKADLSNGIENMVVPCVNYYDNTMPPYCEYSLDRIPTEGVRMNLDPNFLVGCDCEDDCADKSKCSCWQLTLSGARFGNPNTPPENVGYCFKRLLDPVPTGIYECNANCKCKKNCLNRVVQAPLQVKLQVFKTSNRGWGLRCLNDIPKGTFICIYAGHLLTEQKANEGGVNASDEYFAELDYIEVVERLKEGYESDVAEENESEDEELEEPNPDADSDEDFRSKCNLNKKDGSINTRLRTRRGTTDEDKRKKPGTEAMEESQERRVINFEPNTSLSNEEQTSSNTKYKSIRRYFGKNEFCYIMDAKKTGNIGRYFNHSCSPNLFVQNVFVDTQDLRFPWVAFFALTHIRAGTELTWNYNYEVGIVPGKVLYCECGAPNCRGRLL